MLVATAGHVDHGKTSLIKQLTGTNTDRLEQEKQRGLTIELGYAFAESGESEPIGFIDVPGHQRFINTMISGVSGIDLGMLVVAADDGPMPQTIEHLQLLQLLGVTRFIAVITKCDLVDRARLDQVTQQVEALIPDAPLCEISDHTGAGLERLQSILENQLQYCLQPKTESQFRLYVDRAFIKKGAGVVVTGTSLSGCIKVGDELRLHTAADRRPQTLPQTLNVRVREIHTQGAPATQGHAGQRCALNLAGKVSIEDVHRGDFLCAHPTARPSRRLDARYQSIEGSTRPLKHLGRVKLYIGTRRVAAKTYFLDRDKSDPSSQRIQLILDSGIIAFAGDRFVLRDDNESTTLGGGVIIDPVAPQWGKSRSYRLKQLDALELCEPRAALDQLLFHNDEKISFKQCKRIWNLSQDELDLLLNNAPFQTKRLNKINTGKDEFIIASEVWQGYLDFLDQRLTEWHNTRPMEPGIAPDTLQRLVQEKIPKRIFKAALNDRISAGEIVHQEQLVRALGHRTTLSAKVQREWQQLERLMTRRGLDIPLRSELQQEFGFNPKQLEALTRPAIKTKKIVEIGAKRLALTATIEELAKLIKEFTDGGGELSVIEAKKVFGLGRNTTIEILEFFDHIGFTKRSGNARLISDSNATKLFS